ncbi:M56 family metallopeptidase [Qipengyuania nanhaisediminis]|uniref:M56 family metallopeptidase n=1 Tax=Qipengyuania nanhaisediminis TaxID=604088 RepID=UPI0038B2AE00
MSALSMESVLVDTLLWTGLLIAVVLLVRRLVARWFGPQTAYALWALPALRLVLPPIELPAWMRPAETGAQALSPAAGEPLIAIDPLALAASNGAAAAAPGAGSAAAFDPATLVPFALAIWLVGACAFLYLRFAAYFRLRDELLDGAHEVGRCGNVRLIETPGTGAPLAFGVIDKVIALPEGFLAQPDRQARDLALAHELAHHEGRDLLVNVLVQPLFAMHWFNPLARYGWLALRRDQEAACDARVMAATPAEDLSATRNAYAALIAGFAARANPAPSHALAAPMACPVLGDKSIIHRLRSLNMNDKTPSRRATGRLLLAGGVIALPLTASISYAASEIPLAPVAPQAASAPAAPLAPLAPAPALVQDREVDVEIEVETDGEGAMSGDERRERRVIVIREDGEHQAGEHADGEHARHVERRVIRRHGGDLSDAEREEIMVEVRRGLAEADRTLDDMPRIIEEAMASAEAHEGRTVVKMECDGSSNEVATTTEDDDGNRTVRVCRTRIMAHALEGLREARAEIAGNEEFDEDMRARLLSELDQKIAEWENREG